MDALTALGVVSTGAAILFYHLEPRHSLWVLAFAVASFSSSVYAFLQGAWPFGVAELFWVGVALHRYSLLWRGGARAYVPGARSRQDDVGVPHCHAGYPLRLLDGRPNDRQLPTDELWTYRPATAGRVAVGS